MYPTNLRWLLATVLFIGIAANAEIQAEDPNTIAMRLFQRLAGVKTSMNDPRIADMASKIRSGDRMGAAEVAVNDASFINITGFNYFAPKSVRQETADSGFNDFVAMGMLVLRDNRPYTDMVQGDFTVSIAGLPATYTVPGSNPIQTRSTTRSLANNDHYFAAELLGINLKDALTPVALQRNAAFSPEAAGALTSRQFMLEHAIAGTNRRMVEFAFREFLCTPIKNWRDSDPSLSDELVTRDVPRSPGSDAMVYQSECRLCHQLLDPLRSAWANHDFVGTSPVFTPNTIVAKLNDPMRVEYPEGASVTGNAFVNRATLNQNAQFGWDSSTLSGNGAKAFGQMIAKADRFASCAVEQAFSLLCKRNATVDEKKNEIRAIADSFKNESYNLRNVFKRVAILPQCSGVMQ